VHRIKVSKIIYVAETLTMPREFTEAERRKEPLLKQFRWIVETKNLTPKYGSYWKRFSLKSFDLAKEIQ
jgi:hypothetical protein